MLVLMRVTADDRDAPDFASACFRKFRDTFYDHVHDKEVYLYDPTDDEDVAEAISLIDGRERPDSILELARGWNASVERLFDASLRQLAEHAGKDAEGNTSWLTGRTTDIYQMKKAAMALDGQVHDSADHALLVNAHAYPTALFEPAELAAVESDPGSYVSFEVWPK